MKLRNYQKDVIADIRNALKFSKKILVVLPTRTGKTIIFSDMAEKIESANKIAWILTHRAEIFDQTLLKLRDFGISVGQIKASRPLTENLIQLGMIKTIGNKIKKEKKIAKENNYDGFKLLKRPDYLFIDEAHHVNAPSWADVLDFFDDVPRIGFTATPERLDGSGLDVHFDRLIEGPSIQWMVDNFWLSNPVHLCPPSPLEKENIKIKYGDFDKQTQADIMKKHIV